MDNKISQFISDGKPREAIKYALKEAATNITNASSVYSFYLNDPEEALRLAQIAFSINPYDASVCGNLSCLLMKEKKYQEAKDCCEKSLERVTNDADLWFNYGTALMNMGKLRDAAQAFRTSLEIRPNCPQTNCQLAAVLYPLGEFEEALIADQWRFQGIYRCKKFRQRYDKPDWDGSSPKNKRILVFNEQGIGDTIQFARYLYLLKQYGAYVIFEVQKEVAGLFLGFAQYGEDYSYIDEVIVYDENPKLPKYDCVVSLLSLPYFFDPKFEEIPMIFPYIYPLMDEYKNVAREYKDYYRIGIVWAGNATHSNDKDRSCPLKWFKPLAEIPNVKLFSFQHGNMRRSWGNKADSEDLVVNLVDGVDFEYVDLSPWLTTFDDSALVLRDMNLLISVDTSLVHIAGALDLPVWLLQSYNYEWRWQKKWYNSLRIFRQPNPGNWEELLKSVAEEVKKDVLGFNQTPKS